MIHGAFSSWYPYPFVDVITHGYARVLLNGALVVVVLAIVTALFWVGDRRLPTTPESTAQQRANPLMSRTQTGPGGRQVPRSEYRSHEQHPVSLGLVDERVRASPAGTAGRS